jgi:hypothetical protein
MSNLLNTMDLEAQFRTVKWQGICRLFPRAEIAGQRDEKSSNGCNVARRKLAFVEKLNTKIGYFGFFPI